MTTDVESGTGGGDGRPQLPFGAALRDALGAPGEVRLLDSSPRSSVWAAELPRGGPVVVKQLVQGPGAGERYAREVAGLRIAGRLSPPVTPRLLGTDPSARVLVLERVEHGAPGEGWEVAYATALARLHATAPAEAAPADTAPAEAAPADTAAATAPADTAAATAPADTAAATAPADTESAPLPRWSGPGRTDIDSFLTLARWLGAAVPAQVPDELERLTRRLDRTPRRPALLHGDPCPGNDLHTADGIRFIDFEQASLGNGLNELAYLRVGFPTCWCVTAAPEPLLLSAEAAYRSTWREATGTEPEGELADACAGWLIRGDALVERALRGSADQLARLTREDWTWGTATARQRLLHRLEVVARMVRNTDTSLAGLGTLSADMAGRVLTRWPELRPVRPAAPTRTRDRRPTGPGTGANQRGRRWVLGPMRGGASRC
ncbi:Phosphotransferase enzyme family protein [Streptomyces sp. S4.7]|uniref:phosphotransferase n=1 Tax=Streptomyces sp. S4.7 TaxID=2705439 RepID=UPI001398147E|nr:phosphotransferase [Streptomyces sp. S4.7]QHY97873.1 Phosphotransferase enzyme family protein [Streptomyces sp. S4.7]